MKRLFCALFACAAMLVGCGDDDSDFVTRPDGKDSSSSVKPNSSNSTSKSSGSTEVSEAPVKPCKTEKKDNCVYGKVTDKRDGQVYKTVVIGDQVWMAQNMNLKTEESSCYYDSDENCSMDGRFYTWADAMDRKGEWSDDGKGCSNMFTCSARYPIRGICPEGWHLPSREEFKILIESLGGMDGAGDSLKSTSGWEEYDGFYKRSGNGSDAYGFGALPVGYLSYDNPVSEGFYVNYWSATECGDECAHHLSLSYFSGVASVGDGYGRTKSSDSFPVRCVKD